MSSATERAIKRMATGQSVGAAAASEGLAPSTLYRALKRGAAAAHGRTVIVGAGAMGRELMGWLRLDGRAEEIVFLDDAEEPGHALCKRIATVAGYVAEPGDELLLSVTDPLQRERLAGLLGQPAASFVALTATTSSRAAIGAGSLLLPHSLVSVDAIVGACVILNAYSSVGHDVELGDFCTLSSHVDLCGNVKVGKRVFFGSGARVLPRTSIGDDAVIGAGAVVVKDVPAGAVMFGNPARAVS